MIKKIASATVGLGLILASVTPTFAVSNGCQNLTTGPNSFNFCNTLLSKFHSIGITNNGTVNHTINKTLDSGNNNANNNTASSGNLTINTGNAAADVLSQAALNTANATVNQTDSPADHIGTNNITGPSSNNTVNVTNNKTFTLTLGNNGSIVHRISVDVNSGKNNMNTNTITGGIMTGHATSNTSVGSIMNDLVLMVTQ